MGPDNRTLDVEWLEDFVALAESGNFSRAAEARAIAQPVLESCVRDSLNFDPKYGAGQDAFDALQRLVDRIDPTYRS